MQFQGLTNSTYRPDIDGLRAIAVLSVVGYHAFPEWIRGGFIGVDVFFVISGFLISCIIFNSLASNSLSFLDFYVRRIKRIFPALIVVLIASCLFGWFALLPDEYKKLGLHIANGAGFISNFLLWDESGYFDTSAALKPLLHLWSLSIEMQFYAIFPVLLWLAWRLRVSLFGLIFIGLIISFVVSVVEIKVDAVGAFYSPAARFWELLLGGVLGYFALSKPLRFSVARGHGDIPHGQGSGKSKILLAMDSMSFKNLFSVAGLLFVIVAILTLNKDRAFPGWWALLPTIATGFLIYAGPAAVINRCILSRRCMVWIGLISYPLYLWHWPILSFARIMESGTPAIEARIIAMLVSVFLAWVTYKWVELPARNRKYSFSKTFALSCLLIIVGAVGYDVYKRDGLEFRSSVQSTLKHQRPIDWANDGRNTDEACQERYSYEGKGYCLITNPDQPPTVALVGDSHANHFFWGLSKYYGAKGDNLLLLGSAGCVPFFDVESQEKGQKDTCRELINSSLRYALQATSIRTIILASRGPLYVTGRGFGDAEAGMYDRYLKLVQKPSINDNMVVYRLAMEATLSILTGSNKEVIFAFDVPELGFDPSQCADTRPLRIFGVVRSPCAISKRDFKTRNESYIKNVQSVLQMFPMVKVFDPSKYLCDSEYCWAARGGILLYRDDNHLSYGGSVHVGRMFAPEQARNSSSVN